MCETDRKMFKRILIENRSIWKSIDEQTEMKRMDEINHNKER